jgi:anaerobic selenocysteine-containing dehydrogenase
MSPSCASAAIRPISACGWVSSNGRRIRPSAWQRSPACRRTISVRPRVSMRQGGNAAIYYGLGVTEHSQGSTMVMGWRISPWLTGNIGRRGVGVNPLRGQNNVQGACDMGSFPHELSGYRHVSDDATRELFERSLGRHARERAGPAHPEHVRCCPRRQFQGPLCPGRGYRAVRSEYQHVSAALTAMECIVVQDLFLNETADFAHVFLPGASFLEKDGTFTNAERRISRVRKAMPPLAGMADWEVTVALSKALGYPMHYNHPSRDHGRDRASDADLCRRQLRSDRRTRQHPVAVQRQGAGRHADHAYRRVRARQGQVHGDRICADRRAHRAALPAVADHRPDSRSTMSAHRPGARTT